MLYQKTYKTYKTHKAHALMKAIDREQQAEAEIGHTTFSRGVPLFLTTLLLLIVFGVLLLERLQPDGVPLADDALHLAPSIADISDTVEQEGAYDAFFSLNRAMLGNMERLASDLERSSPLRQSLLPPMNRYLTGRLGAQNADVLRGRDGWLFYGPAVAHLTGPGFMSPDLPHPNDPVEALAAFHDQLASRGIALVVVPLPVKASIHPEQLSSHAPADRAIQSASHVAFLAALAARGVLACDVTEALISAKASGPVYLARDSHWTPEGMHVAAEAIQAFLRDHVPELTQGDVAYRAGVPRTIEHAGDLAVMLAPDDAARYGMGETIQHQAVEGPDGTLWAPDPSGRVLLLGDSFTNIFELEGMGWGAHGGLAAWLSLLLQQPLDAITQNGDGAHATRLRLNQALQRGEDRLAGKAVVVFAFAARELSLGDWKPELKLPVAATASRQRPEVSGRIPLQSSAALNHSATSCESEPEA